jgi:sporulation protein YlmC with PRC-barrel domain
MRVTELKGRQVVDPTTASKRGRVVDVLVDPTTKRLAGLTIAADGEESHLEIAASRIARIGSAAVMLRRDGEGDNGDRNLRHEDYLDYNSLVGLEVLDEGGEPVGRLQDAKIDPDRLAITGYALVGTGWQRWLRLQSDIGPSAVTAWSRELVLVERSSGPRSGFLAPALQSSGSPRQPQALDGASPREPNGSVSDTPQPSGEDVGTGVSAQSAAPPLKLSGERDQTDGH